jgi:hypothetical protein
LCDLTAYYVDRGLAQDQPKITAMGRCFPSASPAELWWHGFTNGAGKNVGVFDDVVTAFKKRFIPADTLLQMAQQREALVQKAGESVAAYDDRIIVFTNTLNGSIEAGLDTLLEEVLTNARVPQAADRTAIIRELKTGFNLLHTNMCGSLNFCAGLQGSLKQELFKMPKVDTKEDLVETAQRCETAISDTQKQGARPQQAPPVVIAGIETSQAGQQQQQRVYKKPAWLPLSALPPTTCYKCGFMRVRDPATHNSRNCNMAPEKWRWREAVRWYRTNVQNQPNQQNPQRPAVAAVSNPGAPQPSPAPQNLPPNHPPPQHLAGFPPLAWGPPAPPVHAIQQQNPSPAPQQHQANAMAFPFHNGSYGDF